MQYLTANLSGGVRRSTLNGREHLVVPLTMIVPGVLNGSQGPILYTPEENSKNPEAWNHMPIVVYHPTLNGKPTTARTPEVLERSSIGIVLSSKADPRVVSEGWFDVEKTRKVDQRVLVNLEAGIPMELSTGLGMDKVPAKPGANYNGIPYDYIATNYRPDHLAVLPDQVGACSIKDGCGVLVNEMSHEQLSAMLEMELRKTFKQDEPGVYIVQVYDEEFVYEQGDKLYKVSYTKGEESVKVGKKPVQVVRKVSFDPVSNDGTRNKDSPPANKQPIPVPPITQPVDNKDDDSPNNEGDNHVDRTKVIDYLIANCGCWEESDREVLNNFPDEKLTSLKAHVDQHVQLTTNAKNQSKPTAADLTDNELQAELDRRTKPDNSSSQEGTAKGITDREVADIVNSAKPKTYEDWMNEAPPEIKEVVENAKQVQESQKRELVKRIVGNSKAPEDKLESFTRALLSKPMDELEMMASVLPVAQPERQAVPSYAGAAAPIGNYQMTQEEEDDYLDTPVVNWEQWAEEDRKRRA